MKTPNEKEDAVGRSDSNGGLGFNTLWFLRDCLWPMLSCRMLRAMVWLRYAWDWVKYLFNIFKRGINVFYLRTKRLYLSQKLDRVERRLAIALGVHDISPFVDEPNVKLTGRAEPNP